MFVAKNGQIALDYLEKKNGFFSVVQPDIIVLDLNLPMVNGFDVLTFVKSSNTLRSIPVVVLTGSLNPSDETKARSLGATSYCLKPSNMGEYEATIKCLNHALVSQSKRNDRNGPDGPTTQASWPKMLPTAALKFAPTWEPFANRRFDHRDDPVMPSPCHREPMI